MRPLTQDECNEVADFVVENSDGLYGSDAHAHIAQYAYVHSIYGTLMVVRKSGAIVAVCRWNWLSSGEAKIIDLIIREDFRNKQVARDMLLKAKMAMPRLEHISFQRKKYAMRVSGFPISRWLKENYYGRLEVTNSH